MKKRVSLQRKLVVSIVCLLTGSLLFALIGTYAYLAFWQSKFDAALSPEAYEAYYNRDWEEEGLPPPNVLEEISMAEVQYLDPSYQNEFWVFVLLSSLAVFIGFGVAIILSKRLTRPLEIASKSAKIIADGDFLHHMNVSEDASTEIASLSKSFQYLTSSLRKMEEDVRYTSASIAHELRTPLTVIQGYIQGIQDGVFKADDSQLDLILGQVSSLSRLIDDLKIVSLAESSQLSLQLIPTDLDACLEEAIAFMRPQFESADHTLHFQPFAESFEFLIDPERIKQAIIALLSNSLRYGGQEGQCTVRCTRKNNTVSIITSDTGPGFSQEALENASQRFWRGDNSRARESGGTGLGLAVVKAIAEAHGGSMTMSKATEGGAQVTINMPNSVPD